MMINKNSIVFFMLLLSLMLFPLTSFGQADPEEEEEPVSGRVGMTVDGQGGSPVAMQPSQKALDPGVGGRSNTIAIQPSQMALDPGLGDRRAIQPSRNIAAPAASGSGSQRAVTPIPIPRTANAPASGQSSTPGGQRGALPIPPPKPDNTPGSYQSLIPENDSQAMPGNMQTPKKVQKQNSPYGDIMKSIETR